MAEINYNQNPNLPRPRTGMIAVVSQALAVLQDGAAAKVAELIAYMTANYPDVTVGAGFQVPQDDAWFDYIRAPLKCPSYPSICIVPYTAKMLSHSIQDEYKNQRPWVVDVVCQGTSPDDLTVQLKLWEIAIFELLGPTDCLACGLTLWQSSAWNKPVQTIANLGSLVADLPMLFTTDLFEYPDPNQ